MMKPTEGSWPATGRLDRHWRPGSLAAGTPGCSRDKGGRLARRTLELLLLDGGLVPVDQVLGLEEIGLLLEPLDLGEVGVRWDGRNRRVGV